MTMLDNVELHDIFGPRFPYLRTFWTNSLSGFKWEVERGLFTIPRGTGEDWLTYLSINSYVTKKKYNRNINV